MFCSKFRLMGLLAVVLCVWLLPSGAEAQKVHALLVLMDADPSLGNTVKVDEEHVRGLLQKVEGVYGTNVKALYSSAGETTISNIQREIRALRPGPDDVVLFYFSGHGGMISQTDKRTYLVVSDPADPRRGATLFRSDVEMEVNTHNCRLKLIITDCCSSYPLETGARNFVTFVGTRGTSPDTIRNLFGAHKGLLHANGATEGQYGWGSIQGGLFTEAFVEAVSGDSDSNKDGFIEWSEVFAVARSNTGTRWDRLNFEKFRSDPNMDPEQVTRQRPKAYSLPERSNGKTTELISDLWDLMNASYSGIDISLDTDKNNYRLDELITFEVSPEKDCYVTILNWDTAGNLTQLFPNKFDQNNRLKKDRRYTFPPAGARYEFFMTDRGTERVKVLVVTDKHASEKINSVLSYANPQDLYRGHTITLDSNAAVPRIGMQAVSKKLTKEDKISKILMNLDSDEWGESRVEKSVR